MNHLKLYLPEHICCCWPLCLPLTIELLSLIYLHFEQIIIDIASSFVDFPCYPIGNIGTLTEYLQSHTRRDNIFHSFYLLLSFRSTSRSNTCSPFLRCMVMQTDTQWLDSRAPNQFPQCSAVWASINLFPIEILGSLWFEHMLLLIQRIRTMHDVRSLLHNLWIWTSVHSARPSNVRAIRKLRDAPFVM